MLLSLVSFILIPVQVYVSQISSSLIVVTNFTLVILAGLSICQRLKNNYFYHGIGVITLITIWLEFIYPNIDNLKLGRLASSFLLFLFLSFVLIKQLISDKSFNLKSILGAISGFLFIGLIGGVMFETMQYLNPKSFIGVAIENSYTFYYFSFVSITTVGYGDVTPALPPAQAITILMSIVGQFYLAVVVAVFVGKFLSTNSKTN
tara:strand:+ start:2523 stop:3137 length:615 start_codon:yes stop_codon:yes gene_type:complete